jgi:trehalose 6-phosphate synthase
MSPRLIIVSNRVVAPEEADSSLADEMAATVKAALKNQNGMWFGWSGKMTDQPASEPRTHQVNKVTYARSTCRRATFRNIATGSPIACSGLFSTAGLTSSNTPVPRRAGTCA